MKRKPLKWMAVLLSAGLLFSLVACGGGGGSGNTSSKKGSSSQGAAADTSEEVELVMYLIGDPTESHDSIMEQLRPKMKEDLNIKLTINYMPWGDWRTKYPMILASGEQCDLIFTADWAEFALQAGMGGFLPLEDLLDKTPTLKASLPEAGWQQATLDEHVYMVPSNAREYECYGFLYRKDLAEKYGITEEIKNPEQMEIYLKAIKDNETDMMPYNAGSYDVKLIELMYASSKPEVLYPLYQEDWNIYVKAEESSSPDFTPIVDEYEDDFMDFILRMREWQQQGFWSRNILANQTSSRDAFKAGTSAVCLVNMESFNGHAQAAQASGWDVGFYDFNSSKPVKTILPLISNGMAIPASSKNAERALQLLEKLHTDPDYYMLTTFGVQGEDYELNDEGKLVVGSKGEVPDGLGCPWGWRDDTMAPVSAADVPQYTALKAEYGKSAEMTPLTSVVFDISSIETEMAAVGNVASQYKTPLIWGLVDDVDAGYQEMISQLESAGYQKIIDELTKQYKENIAALKN